MEKNEFRRQMIEKRDAMSPSKRADCDHAILTALTGLPAYQAAAVVFAYVSVGSEPDTRALIGRSLADGKRVCVPFCLAKGVMEAREIRSFDDLQNGKYDIPEPKAGCPAVPPEQIDFIVAPCVCADRGGYRLGYGGGFYDRWLEKRGGASTTVLCYEALLVDAVPRETHDVCVDMVVTGM
jgi:5-formyltetrahydrofolate cyclo-ligase